MALVLIDFFQQEVDLNHVHFWKSVNISGIPKTTGKFQHRLALPNIKYNCAVLFLRQVNYLFNYAPKTKNSTEKKILIDFNVKTLECLL